MLLEPGHLGLRVGHAAREHELVRDDEPAVAQTDGEPALSGLGRLDDVRGDRGVRVSEHLLPAAGQQLARRLRVAPEVAVGVLHLVRAVLAGVDHEDAPAEPREPRRGRETRGAAADHEGVDLPIDLDGGHGTGSR